MKKLKNKSIIVQNIRAKNNIFGNPNRIYLIYDTKMNYLGWIDEGYAGTNFMMGRKVKELPSIKVTGTRDYKNGTEFKNEGLK